MATRMSLWKLNPDGTATTLPDERLASEEQIESAIESAPELLGIDVLIVGRQTQTPSGPLDLLAIDGDGRLVIIENKRDRTPRDVLAQAIDYAAWANSLTFAEVALVYSKYRRSFSDDEADLAEAYEERFGEELEAIAEAPRMIVVASRLDDATERMIEFLADTFGVSVNAVLFQPFEGGLIGRTWLRPDELGSRAVGRRTASSTASREAAKAFWDAWLGESRSAFPDIRLPKNGPRSVVIKRRIIPGVPAALTVWVSASEAYAEIQFDDDDPVMNEALLATLQERQDMIETSFGEALDWRALEANGLMTKRTKVVSPKVGIGDRANPTAEGLAALTDVARRILDAVKPHLAETFETVTALADDNESSPDDPDQPIEEPAAGMPLG